MKQTTIVESGIIGMDGQLHCPHDRLGQYYKEHKGERVVITIEASPRRSTEAQRGYYRNYIIPTLRQAFFELGERLTYQQVDLRLRKRAEWLFRREDGTYRDIYSLSLEEMSEYIDWIKQFAAEPPLSVYVEDSKTL